MRLPAPLQQLCAPFAVGWEGEMKGGLVGAWVGGEGGVSQAGRPCSFRRWRGGRDGGMFGWGAELGVVVEGGD